jgi:DUF917 family protein
MTTPWHPDEDDARAIAVGSGILGTGGGGNPYLAYLRLRELLRRGARPQVIDVDDVPEDALVCGIGGMGAPTVGVERIAQGWEHSRAVDDLAAYAGSPIDYVASGEIGGGNAFAPLIVAAQSGRRAVDADGMGRAFPELQMSTFMMGGGPAVPGALHDPHGNSVIFHAAPDARWVERVGRAATVAMGGNASLALPLMSGARLRQCAIRRTLSLARAIGSAVLEARARHASTTEAVFGVVPDGRLLFEGKVVDVLRRTTGGFARGSLRLEGGGRALEIDFQNEYLIAREGGEVRVCVPDLICLVAQDTGEPVTTEVLRYGLRVAVLALPAPLELKRPEALAVVGPRAFGYEVDFAPLPGELLRTWRP